MKKVNILDIFYIIWFLISIILGVTLLLVIIFSPKEQLTSQIIAIVLIFIAILIAIIGEGYAIYSLISNIKKNSREK